MTQFIKKLIRLFSGKKESIENSSVLFNSPEKWENEWKEIHENLESRTMISLDEYLQNNPGKEESFLLKLKFSESRKPAHNFSYKTLGFTFAFIILLTLVIYWRSFDNALEPEQSKLSITKIIPKGDIVSFYKKQIIPIKDSSILSESQTISLSQKNDFLEIYFGNLIFFRIDGPAKITIEKLPGLERKIHFFIQKGKISIRSHKFENKPEILWRTKNFDYSPLGTIAFLKVDETGEILKVQEGSFIKSAHSGVQEKILAGKESIYKENQEPVQIEPKEKEITDRDLENGSAQTIKLKNGETHSGILYKKNNKIYIKTAEKILEFNAQEIEEME